MVFALWVRQFRYSLNGYLGVLLCHHFPYQLIDHCRVGFAFHGTHGLAYDKAHGFFFAGFKISHGLGVGGQKVLDDLLEGAFITDYLKAFGLYIGFRVNVVGEYFFEDGAGYGPVDDIFLHQADQLCQVGRAEGEG